MEIVYDVDGLRDYLERVGARGRRDDLPRPLPGGLDRGRRRRAVRRRGTSGSPGSCSTSRRPGSTPETRRACCRRTRSAARCSTQIREQTTGIARALGVVGLLNVQFAIHGDDGLHVIEANPRASRTVPFVSKAIGLPLAKLACRILLGERIAELGSPRSTSYGHVCVKEAVLPFNRFAGADSLLGPGDALDRRGDGDRRATSRPRSPRPRRQRAPSCPSSGTVFITVADGDKPAATGIATHAARPRVRDHRHPRHRAVRCAGWGFPARQINKIGEGSPHVVDWIERGAVDLVINTPVGTGARTDGYEIRSAAIARRDPVHHDDVGRDGCGAGDRGRPARRARGDLAPGAPRAPAGRAGIRSAVTDSVPSAAGARSVRGRRRHRPLSTAPTRSSPARTPAGPRPRGRAVLHARRPPSGGAGGPASGPFLPRAFSVLRAPAGGDELQFLIEDVGPGTEPPVRARGGRRAADRRPARDRVRAAARRPAAVAVGGRRRDRAARDLAGRAAASAVDVVTLLGFRDAPHAEGAALLSAPQIATDDGSAGHHGLVTELLARRARPDARPRCTRAGRRRCSRRSRAVRQARRPGPARAGVRDGVRLRGLLWLCRAPPGTATSGCASRAGARRRAARDGARRRERAIDQLLRHRARRTRSSTRRARSTRSPRGGHSATG